MTTTTEVVETMLALAGATVLCRACKGTGEQTHFPAPQMAETMTCDCVDEGPKPGRVYFFDGVRVPCLGNSNVVGKHRKDSACTVCHLRGWTPVTDGWEEQTTGISIFQYGNEEWAGHVQLKHDIVGYCGGDFGKEYSYKSACLAALLQAVKQVPGVEI